MKTLLLEKLRNISTAKKVGVGLIIFVLTSFAYINVEDIQGGRQKILTFLINDNYSLLVNPKESEISNQSVEFVNFNLITGDKTISNIDPNFNLTTTRQPTYHLTKESKLNISQEESMELPKVSASASSSLIWNSIKHNVDKECLAKTLLKRENYSPLSEKDELEFLLTDEGKQYKTILGWNYAYGPPSYGYKIGNELFRSSCCRENRCFWSSVRNDSRFPISKFDAILFHFRSLKLDSLPKERSEHQRWVFYEMESPGYSYQDPANFDHLFNWTMTYRRDSDVYLGYGYTIPNNEIFEKGQSVRKNWRKKLNSLKKQKKPTTAWMVSHCNTLSFREKLVKQVQRYIPVDVYGDCGTLQCSKDKTAQCYRMMEQKYKFYLSFENSLCKDYITEKFFYILNYNMVPVVFGYGDYDAVAPPHSYINAKSFRTTKALADYLIYLNNNDTAYKEYFEWKEDYTIIGKKDLSFCNLCALLHSDTKMKTYRALSKWFLQDAHCKRMTPLSLLENIFKIRIE